MKKILFSIEYSNHDQIVLQYASEMAYLFNAQLIITNIFSKSKSIPDQYPHEGFSTSEINRLKNFVNINFPKDHRCSVQISFISEPGLSENDFIELIGEEQIDLVIMGLITKSKPNQDCILLDLLSKVNFPLLLIPDTLDNDAIDRMLDVNLKIIHDYDGLPY